MEKTADLHIHTYYSDSSSSPEEVVIQAKEKGLSCIAVTDHDTIDGINPTRKEAQQYGIEVISGIELSTQFQGKDIHILGYLFDHENKEFCDFLETVQNMRQKRMQDMIKKLAELGVDNIDFEEVCALTESKAVGRPHLAQILVKKGIVKNMRAAFRKYLGDDGLVYVEKEYISPYEAIRMIKGLGGVAVLAHPRLTSVDELISGFVREGLGGLEVYYPNSSKQIIDFYERLVAKHNIVATGGSDAHGDYKTYTYIGKEKVPYQVVENLRNFQKNNT